VCIFHRSITREQQDTLAARSHARAAAAQKSGRFDSQIVPVRTQWRDPKTKEVTRILVEKDDGIREGTTLVSFFYFLFIFLFSHFNLYMGNWTEQFVFNSHRIPSPSCPPFSRRADPPPLETRRKSPTAPGAWSSRGVRTPTPKVCPSWDGSYPSPRSESTPKSWVSFFLFSYGKLD